MTEPASKSVLKSFSTSRPVAISMVFLAAAVFGFFSFQQLPITLMPELSYPTLTVRTEYAGAAPEEVENDISRPIEDALGVVGGLTRVSSISRAGVSDVVLEFSWDVDMSEAIQDTLEKLDLVFLPDDAERPLILRFDPSLDPVLELSLSGQDDRFEGEEGLRRLRRIADLQIRRFLEPVKGVAAVRIRGGLEEEIHVLIDEEQLRRTGLPIRRVIDRLRQENVNVAGGTLKEGRIEYMVRTLNEYQNLDQIADTVIARIDERDVRLRDLAQVEMAHKERQMITRTDGNESVQIDIFKEADANMVALSKAVQGLLGQFNPNEGEDAKTAEQKPELPEWLQEIVDQAEKEKQRRASGLTERLYTSEGVLLQIVADRSVFIENSIDEVKQTAILGGILAVIVLFLFLRNFRSTAIIAVSIPISLVITFAPLNILGVSLNIMSLGGLALGIGMLVDSSIVVLESIFRCSEEGDDLVSAAVRGTSEVRGAVIASTLTSIAVFFPMVFVEGVAGQAFGDLGLAVVISLLAALLVAITFIPMLASRRGLEIQTAGLAREKTPWLSIQAAKEDFRSCRGWMQQAAWRNIPGALYLLYIGVRMLLQLTLEAVGRFFGAILFTGTKLLASVLRRLVIPLFRAVTWPFIATVSRLLDIIQGVYPRVLRLALRAPFAVVVLALGLFALIIGLGRQLDSELLPEVHQGLFTVETFLPVGTPLEETDAILAPVEKAILEEREHIESLLVTLGFDPANSQRSDEGEHTARFKVLLDAADPRIEAEVIARLRQRFAAVPDVDARITRPVLFSFKTPIEVEIHGEDLVELKAQAALVEERLAGLGELADVETTLRSGAPEVQIVYDRDLLARYDLDIAQVADLVRDSVKGFEATRFNLEDRRIPILVRFQEKDRATVEDVRNLVVNPEGERPVPLAAVADVVLGEGPSEVRRIDGRRVALVRANIADTSLGNAVQSIEGILDSGLEWPANMTAFITGQNLEWQRSQRSLLLALSLSIFLVYVIMAAQFESLLQPLVIMLTIPLAFLGTIIALRILEISLSIVVFLGMIMLAGIVVNNAIVLVDYINVLKRRGATLEDAVVQAGSVRLRPILMTTATTVLGLLPMAIGLGDGAEIRTPMAIAVISGLIVSTVLTLLIIPTLYALLDRLPRAFVGGPATVPAGDEPLNALEEPRTA